jgi:hypothetical protein
MRLSTAATALWLGLLPIAAGLAADPPAQRQGDPAASTPAAAPSAATPAPGTPAAAASGDAAAKHAKRTGCLKDAKAKKLVGADKTSFLKACIAAP